MDIACIICQVQDDGVYYLGFYDNHDAVDSRRVTWVPGL